MQAGGLHSIAKYSIIFDCQWKNSLGSTVNRSYFNNYTNDLLYSIERLPVIALFSTAPQSKTPLSSRCHSHYESFNNCRRSPRSRPALLLARLNEESREAEVRLREDMQGLSVEIERKAFDEEGLCQGAPFVFRLLDLNVAPYSLAIQMSDTYRIFSII